MHYNRKLFGIFLGFIAVNFIVWCIIKHQPLLSHNSFIEESEVSLTHHQNTSVESQGNNPTLSETESNTKNSRIVKLADFNIINSTNTNDNNRTDIEDVIIAVKSTLKNHATRLALLLDTWIPQAFESTFLITDGSDNTTLPRLASGNYINTHCNSSHHWKDLICKLERIFEVFTCHQKRWYCIADDDTYIIIPNLVKRLSNFDHRKDWYIGKNSWPTEYTVHVGTKKSRKNAKAVSFWFGTGGAGLCFSHSMIHRMKTYILNGNALRHAETMEEADDVVMGYIAHLLNVNLTIIEEFHSHTEAMWLIDPATFHRQVSLSYGKATTYPDIYSVNTILVRKEFSLFPLETDPTRLLSLHCHLFDGSEVCQRLNYTQLISQK